MRPSLAPRVLRSDRQSVSFFWRRHINQVRNFFKG
jgi:hypothetical protein